MAQPNPKLVEETLYAMQWAAATTLARFDESLWAVEAVNLDLVVAANDAIADLYQIQVGIGIAVDFYGRGLARARQGVS
jgi:hypothetical protein